MSTHKNDHVWFLGMFENEMNEYNLSYKHMFYQCWSFTPKLMCFHFDSKCFITRLHRKCCDPDLSCHCLGLWFYAGITKILSNSVK